MEKPKLKGVEITPLLVVLLHLGNYLQIMVLIVLQFASQESLQFPLVCQQQWSQFEK